MRANVARSLWNPWFFFADIADDRQAFGARLVVVEFHGERQVGCRRDVPHAAASLRDRRHDLEHRLVDLPRHGAERIDCVERTALATLRVIDIAAAPHERHTQPDISPAA